MKFMACKSSPPLGSILALNFIKQGSILEWGEETCFKTDDLKFTSNISICRYLARNSGACKLYGKNLVEQCEVDHWLMLCVSPLACENNTSKLFDLLDLQVKTQEKFNQSYIVSEEITVADLAIYGQLFVSQEWQNALKNGGGWESLQKYYNTVEGNVTVAEVLAKLPEPFKKIVPIKNKPSFPKEKAAKSVAAKPAKTSDNKVALASDGTLESLRKEDAKFVELPGAEMGKVVVRFPPEASGYLHIGHAKAALLNQYYKEAFKGTLIMRFDDTNPAKEKVDFEKVILEDLKSLQITPDRFTHTSDYFDLMLELCEKMLKDGTAYVDDTDPLVMKTDREQKVASKNRNNSVETNLKMWNEMKSGSEYGQKCCVRAKIDMESLNGCMRDPTIYRCKNEVHPRTGTKYKVYPTYDFACPIVDSIEGVTHCLRTMEYHDRDAQFYWFIDTLGLRKPVIWEYSRLNMTNTVLSKRKLTWFVENNKVNGWDDPRMPTVRGILRRGMTVEGLKQFVVAQGSSRSVVVMEWDKIWAFNKKVIDPIAPRYTAVEATNAVPVFISGAKIEATKSPKHPKNPSIGEKTVWTGPKLWIDCADAQTLVSNTNVTFINWGNIKISKLVKDNNGIVTEVHGELNLDDKDYKKTLKLTWLAEVEQAPPIPCFCVYFDHIISKAILGKDEDFKNYINHATQIEVSMLGDPELANVEQSEIIQLQRKGFFICDSPYKPKSIHSGKVSPIILYHIPDGHTKEMPSGSILKSSSTKTTNPVKGGALAPAMNDVVLILEKIKAQGDKVRDSKQKKAEKSVIEAEVKLLLEYKSEYKNLTGLDWKPGVEPPRTSTTENAGHDILLKIKHQGEAVRKLKTDKAEKASIDKEVKVLLELKAEFKKVTGKDWKPDMTPVAPAQPHSDPVPNSASSVNVKGILEKIALAGDKVRKLKTEKADKTTVDAEVKTLLGLKSEYKSLTGEDWKPGMAATKSGPSAADLSAKVGLQGDRVRKLKTEKADKAEIDKEVKVLLALKAEYKTLTGQEWKPETTQVKSKVETKPAQTGDMSDLSGQITAQGDKVRKLKTEKAEKSVVDAEVKVLLELKSQYKNVTGQDWKPGTGTLAPQPSPKAAGNIIDDITAKIVDQGNKVRKLKSDKADKEVINEAVKQLLSLKEEYKNKFGHEFPSEIRQSKEKSKEPKQKSKQPSPPKDNKADSQVKKVTRLGMEAKKEENLPDWYSQVITKGELIEYYDVSGCYVLRPWSYAIWETIKDWFDNQIKQLGVKNCYFPMFVSKSVLEKEKAHIADFAPEVAWVTKSGNSDMAEPVAIRPTSETVMYPAYAKWIQSYRDLPIKLNQWNNVVRWEFKHPQPFLRTREFLWQEGHTAFASAEEAQEEVQTILDLYGKIYTDLLAVPVIKGRKTEKEKFAGGDYTLTTEAFISASGRAIQGATSHHLGQNFSKMFDIIYEDPETQEKKFVYQNSWGITTRTIGVLIMVHADNQGLVLPPAVASIQVVIVACGISVSLSEEEKEKLYSCCREVEKRLKDNNIRASSDLRDNYSPGWKFNHWELKGVPLRMEIGPKDMKANQVMVVRRDNGSKQTISNDASIAASVQATLDEIQKALFSRAKEEMDTHVQLCKDWNQFCSLLEQKNLLLSPFCGEINCEDIIKQQSAREEAVGDSGAPAMGAKSLCIPFDQPSPITPSDKCIHPQCSNSPKYYTLFGRSY